METERVRGIRGASVVDSDDAHLISERVQELLLEMMARNELDSDSLISILFTATPDLTASFPAAGARAIGFGDIPLICATEIAVPGSMARCVRVLIHAYSLKVRGDIRHVYLHGAQVLRDDLPE
ncbi:MAG: chorismate mutase [Actinomycetota bacterium]|jgi:chorismate mutase